MLIGFMGIMLKFSDDPMAIDIVSGEVTILFMVTRGFFFRILAKKHYFDYTPLPPIRRVYKPLLE